MSTALVHLRNRVRVYNGSALRGAPVINHTGAAYVKPKSDFKCYGGAKLLWQRVLAGAPQVMIEGPAETGKTTSALHLIDHLCWENPGAQGAMVRKIGADLWGSVVHDFEKKVLHMEEGKCPSGVTKYGGEKPEFYEYPNGSKIWVGGLDHPGKVLSTQRDFVYTNQTEEFEKDDWATISTRTTGRAGVLRPGRLIGDCNPGPSTHWIMALGQAGTLELIKSVHKDNPTLFDPNTGEITAQGKLSMANLDTLPGVLYKRLKLGLWVAAEGVVYGTFDKTVHIVKQPLQPIVRFIASLDWGYHNPGVMQVWGVDGEGRMYRFVEVYKPGLQVMEDEEKGESWIDIAKRAKEEYNIEAFIADPARPEHIQAFRSAGLATYPAFNSITLGIQNVEKRLKIKADGYPSLMFLQGSRGDKDSTLVEQHKPTCTEDEIEIYAYPKDAKGKTVKENPVDENNHGCDAMRYGAAFIDNLGGKKFLWG